MPKVVEQLPWLEHFVALIEVVDSVALARQADRGVV